MDDALDDDGARLEELMTSIVGTSEIGVACDTVCSTAGAACSTEPLDTVIAGVGCDDAAVTTSGVNASLEMECTAFDDDWTE